MVTVLHCKFLKLYEFNKQDKTKGYRIRILEENERDIVSHSLFLSNEIALNCKDLKELQNIAISFDIWLDTNATMRYIIKNIVVEK